MGLANILDALTGRGNAKKRLGKLRSKRRSLTVEALEDRTLLAAWLPQGPHGISDGQVENVGANDEVAGAIHTIAAHPLNPNTVYLGTVNGGMWRSDNATLTTPRWTPQTDNASSLSIGAIGFDLTDPTGNTLVAGTANSFNPNATVNGPLIGLLRTTNGGQDWLPLGTTDLGGQNITGVAPRGDTIVVASDSGISRSDDAGLSFVSVMGGNITDFVSDPSDQDLMYAASTAGVFRSNDAGMTWTDISDATLSAGLGDNTKISLASNGRLYAAATTAGQLSIVAYSDDPNPPLMGTSTWTEMDLPETEESDLMVQGLHPGALGAINLSVVADGSNPNLVYVGGDRQPNPFTNFIGAEDFTGRLFRGDTTVDPIGPPVMGDPFVLSPQWEHLTHSNAISAIPGGGTSNLSAPFAGTHDMIFAGGSLIEVTGGGIYKRTNPSSNSGTWLSMMGNLQITQIREIAYDAQARVIISSNVDTGVSEQISSNNTSWRTPAFSFGPRGRHTGPAGDVAVDDTSTPGTSFRYSSGLDDLGVTQFIRREINSANVQISETVLATIPDPQAVTPIAVNEVDGSRLIIGGSGMIHESLDRGDTNTPVMGGGGATEDAIKYGHASNPDLIVYGSGATVFVRAGDPTDLVNPPVAVATAAGPGVGTITDITWDPNNSDVLYVVGTGGVAETLDGGATWTDITGNLTAFTLYSVEFVNGAPFDGVVVATDMGVYYANQGDFPVLMTDPPPTWNRLGSDFPNVAVLDLDYDVNSNMLFAGTGGRGAYVIQNVGTEVNVTPPPPVFDFGDAPDIAVGTATGDYNTTLADNGPSHPVGGPRLGNTVDGETDGFQSASANGDDLGDTDDEDGVTFSAMIEGQTATVSIEVTNAPGFVNGWIDYDQDGAFAAGEQIVTDQAFVPGTSMDINFTGPTGQNGTTFARFRVQSLTGLAATGPAFDGEVEDYQVTITPVPLDYGDAPDTGLGTGTGNYETLAADGGPSHTATGPRLGTRIDGESDANPTGIANGDDADATDDEDGVSFSNIRAGQNATATVFVTQADGNVDGWIDWNRNGSFTDLGEQIVTSQFVTAGTAVPFTFPVPNGISSSPTFARFRVSTSGGLGPTGSASDGEVEDYHVALQTLDFGDAPDTTSGNGAGDYDTLLANGGAAHIVGGPRLGQAVDEEADGQPSVLADGDDLNGVDDEDGVSFGTLTTSSVGNALVQVSGFDGFVDAWIDFDQSGTFDANEKIINSGIVKTIATKTFQFFVPATAIAGNTYARVRVSLTGGIGPTGLVAGGEVEDYQVAITQGPIVDYGDAPEPNFRTTVANNGASHVITTTGPLLGTNIDGESDGQPDTNAIGDDGDGNDDDDGVVFLGSLLPGGSGVVQVTVSQADGKLDGWIDFNQNRRFDEPAERIANNLDVLSSSGVLIATNRDGSQNELVVINSSTGEVVNTITAPQTVGVLNGIAFDGNHIWYIEGIGGTQDILYQVDLSGGVISSTDLSVDPAVAGNHTFDGLTALNGLIYIQDTTSKRIHVFDSATKAIIQSLNPGLPMSGGLAAIQSPDALLASNAETQTIFEIDPTNGQVTGSFRHSLNAHTGTAVLNGRIYLASLGDSAVTVVNRAGVLQGTLNVTPGAATSSVSLRSLAGGAITAGPNTQLISFQVPVGTPVGNTFARFRVSSTGGLSPVGNAADGEVEDYQVTIGDVDSIGVFRNGLFYQDVTNDGQWNGTTGGDTVFSFGGAGDIPIAGDWNGDGQDEIGIYRPSNSTFYKDKNGNRQFDGVAGGDEVVPFGIFGDLPVIGNWNGDLIDDIAVFRPSMARWYKDANGNGTYDGIAGGDESFIFGATGDIPIAGNWNGDSIDDIGVYRPSNSYFYQDFNDSNSFQPGIDLVIRFGAIGDIPFIGNWNGSATDNIAVFRPATSMVYRDVNGNGSFDAGDSATQFGTAGDQPIAGDWALPTPLLAPTAANESENTVALTSEALTGVADAAIEILVGAGISADELSNINFQIADLTGRRLGQTLGNTITIDVNAAGHGWFVDTSPTDHHEFSIVGRNGLVAEESTLPADHMDLLTVLLHELGHTLNLADDYSSADSANLMSGLLTAGIRRLPTEGELAAMMFDA